mmetsp:Transcript_13567/g.40415  ORF Transcript_13567/g.40415 Transcript_13567/m.40415 type:complete len:241 (+) Transcript_13567:176-898(+)
MRRFVRSCPGGGRQLLDGGPTFVALTCVPSGRCSKPLRFSCASRSAWCAAATRRACSSARPPSSARGMASRMAWMRARRSAEALSAAELASARCLTSRARSRSSFRASRRLAQAVPWSRLCSRRKCFRRHASGKRTSPAGCAPGRRSSSAPGLRFLAGQRAAAGALHAPTVAARVPTSISQACSSVPLLRCDCRHWRVADTPLAFWQWRLMAAAQGRSAAAAFIKKRRRPFDRIAGPQTI